MDLISTKAAAHGMSRRRSGVEPFDIDMTCGQGVWDEIRLWGMREGPDVVCTIDV